MYIINSIYTQKLGMMIKNNPQLSSGVELGVVGFNHYPPPSSIGEEPSITFNLLFPAQSDHRACPFDQTICFCKQVRPTY